MSAMSLLYIDSLKGNSSRTIIFYLNVYKDVLSFVLLQSFKCDGLNLKHV